MQHRVLSEHVAKAGIYLIFSLSLFACLMFVHGARQFDAADAAVDAAAVAEAARAEAQRANASKEAADRPAMVGLSPGEQSSAAKTLKHSLRLPHEEMSQPEEIEAATPSVYGKPLDEAALKAELARMAAMGFTFSSDLSADYVGEFYATSYCAEVYPHICGGNGVTASGTVPTPGLTVASDWNVLPPGTWIYIGGVGIRRVEDSGGAIKGARLDVVLATHSSALRWNGQGHHDVWILG